MSHSFIEIHPDVSNSYLSVSCFLYQGSDFSITGLSGLTNQSSKVWNYNCQILNIPSVVSFSYKKKGPTRINLQKCPPLSFKVCSDSRPLSWWCYLSVSSSPAPFSFCFQSFQVSDSFPMSKFFPSSVQSTGASNSESVLPANIQDWFPLGLTGLIALQS